MPEARYFLKLGGALVLGLIALAIAAVAFLVLLPFILTSILGAALLVLVFILIWAVIYIAMIIGAALYYIFKPMKVSGKDKEYTISRMKEAGLREKGNTKKPVRKTRR